MERTEPRGIPGFRASWRRMRSRDERLPPETREEARGRAALQMLRGQWVEEAAASRVQSCPEVKRSEDGKRSAAFRDVEVARGRAISVE